MPFDASFDSKGLLYTLQYSYTITAHVLKNMCRILQI